MLPKLLECKSLEDVQTQTKAITTAATDILNTPTVQSGYQNGGQSGHTAFINAMSMAKKRMERLFPLADWKDPLYARLMAEAKYICAECIKLKYECRARRQPYDHLQDATIRIQKLVRDCFVDYSKAIKEITYGD